MKATLEFDLNNNRDRAEHKLLLDNQKLINFMLRTDTLISAMYSTLQIPNIPANLEVIKSFINNYEEMRHDYAIHIEELHNMLEVANKK